MKAYRLSAPGLANLHCRDEATPEPAADEVLLRVKAASINYRDLGILAGHYPAAPALIPLSDGAGVVEAVGSAVRDIRPGDEVVSCFYADWQSGPANAANHALSLGCQIDGVLAEWVRLPATAVLAKPRTLSFAEAATLPCAALTAWSALFTEGGLLPGQHVLIQGTGGVAIFALQFARMAGAEITVISSSDEKLQRARSLGATHLLNYRDTPDWSSHVLESTGGRGVDLIVELGGATTLAHSMRCIAVGGHISMVGVLSGLEARFALTDMLFRHSRLGGITVGHREDFRRMNAAIDLHRITPVIDRSFAFDAAAQAYAALPEGKHFGKLVIEF
jgi:NADPH:quinone reductase-like Zn-dependent oxidoreductase